MHPIAPHSFDYFPSVHHPTFLAGIASDYGAFNYCDETSNATIVGITHVTRATHASRGGSAVS